MAKTSKSILVAMAALLVSSAILQAADRPFDDIVRAISDEFQIHPMHIPFFGLVNFATFMVHPAGVEHLDLAVFEDVELDRRDLEKVIRSARPEWLPFVRVRERQETTLLYMTPEQKDCKLLVVSLASGELTLVQLRLNPEAVQALFRRPEKPVHSPLSRTENQDDQ
ncbi:MAG: hypothetical protein ACLPWF_31620 [Bryobacteraceae bacterium]